MADAGIGHNSGEAAAAALTKAAKEKLSQTVEKIERLLEEKREIAEAVKDVYAEAKSMGYDTRAIRSVIKIRSQDRQEREEQEAILETYLLALGLI